MIFCDGRVIMQAIIIIMVVKVSITSDRLLQEIKKKGVSYGQLSKLTGINKADLQRYATGQTKKIPTDRLLLIANALQVPASFLLGSSDYDSLGSLLKSLREKADISYYRLSELSGVDVNNIISYENNLTFPSINELVSISRVIDDYGEIPEFFYDPDIGRGVYDEDYYNKYLFQLGISAREEAKEELALLSAWNEASEKDKKTVAFILGFDYESKEDPPAQK